MGADWNACCACCTGSSAVQLRFHIILGSTGADWNACCTGSSAVLQLRLHIIILRCVCLVE